MAPKWRKKRSWLAFSRRCAAVRGRESLGQYSTDSMRRSINSEQRGERGHQIDGFGVGPIGSGLERQAVKGQGNVCIVVIRRGMIGSLARTHGVEIRNTHHKPTPF